MVFGDVEEDVWDLEDVVEVCFDVGVLFEDFVFVVGDFEVFFVFFEMDEGDVC